MKPEWVFFFVVIHLTVPLLKNSQVPLCGYWSSPTQSSYHNYICQRNTTKNKWDKCTNNTVFFNVISPVVKIERNIKILPAYHQLVFEKKKRQTKEKEKQKKNKQKS